MSVRGVLVVALLGAVVALSLLAPPTFASCCDIDDSQAAGCLGGDLPDAQFQPYCLGPTWNGPGLTPTRFYPGGAICYPPGKCCVEVGTTTCLASGPLPTTTSTSTTSTVTSTTEPAPGGTPAASLASALADALEMGLGFPAVVSFTADGPGVASCVVSAPGTTNIALTTAALTQAGSSLVLAKGKAKVRRAGSATVRVKLTRKGKKFLRTTTRPSATVTATFRGRSGSSTETRQVVLGP